MREHNEQIINRIREALMELDSVEEKAMFGGICFLVVTSYAFVYAEMT